MQSAIAPSTFFEPPEEASPSSALLSGGKALLEGGILSLAGPVDEESPEEARASADAGAEPSIAGNGTNCRAAARADGGAGQRALLRRRHVGAGGERDGDGREQQQLFHGVPQRLISETAGRGSVRSEIETARRSTIEPSDPATSAPS